MREIVGKVSTRDDDESERSSEIGSIERKNSKGEDPRAANLEVVAGRHLVRD